MNLIDCRFARKTLSITIFVIQLESLRATDKLFIKLGFGGKFYAQCSLSIKGEKMFANEFNLGGIVRSATEYWVLKAFNRAGVTLCSLLSHRKVVFYNGTPASINKI